MEVMSFYYLWPWIGLGAAIVLTIMLFATRMLQNDKSCPRWKDPTWVAWLAAVAYMFHNVEEYGIDMTGSALGFPTMIYNVMGFNYPEVLFLFVNLPMIWVVGPVLAVLSRKYPVMALGMPAFELMNTLTHVPGAIALGGYNAGLLTVVVLFVPVVVLALVFLCGRGRIRYRAFFACLLIGLLYHVVLFASVFGTDAGVGSPAIWATVLLIAAALVVWLVYLVGRVNGGRFAYGVSGDARS